MEPEELPFVATWRRLLDPFFELGMRSGKLPELLLYVSQRDWDEYRNAMWKKYRGPPFSDTKGRLLFKNVPITENSYLSRGRAAVTIEE